MGNVLSHLNEQELNSLGVEYGIGHLANQPGAATLLLRAMGQAINPQLQLIYQGLGFRTFTLEFLFTPKSQQESDSVSAIINTFVYAMHPTINTQNYGMYFTPPSIFDIQFMMAQTGNFQALGAMLQKSGNSLISGVPLGNIAANALGTSGTSTGQPNNRLYKTGRCVLEDLSVDYAPNGWSAYTGGATVQTRLTLSFKEIEILDRSRMAAGAVW